MRYAVRLDNGGGIPDDLMGTRRDDWFFVVKAAARSPIP
jgi:glycine cleavage system aminomethyltransferase T